MIGRLGQMCCHACGFGDRWAAADHQRAPRRADRSRTRRRAFQL